MLIRVNGVKAPLNTCEIDWARLIAKRLRVPLNTVHALRLVRKSVDARDKGDVCFVLTFDADVDNAEQILRSAKPSEIARSPEREYPQLPDRSAFKTRPVVVGAGPAGLFAALILALAGAMPILLERGRTVEERIADVEAMRTGGILDPESNVQFGEGGAGTFSDGKLNTGIKSPWCRYVLETFAAHGADRDILTDQLPHIGTDRLRSVITSLRTQVIELGGDVRFGTRLESVAVRNGRITGVYIVSNGQPELIETDTVILAIGHSARDTFLSLKNSGVVMEQKPFAVGVRIEHPQELINRSQYGKFAADPHLGAAPYKLSVHTPDGRGVYTFCMCPGGEVINAASEPGGLAVNGMSLRARDGVNANAALLTGIRPEDFGSDDPLAGIAWQRKMEQAAFIAGGGNYSAPVQRAEDLLEGRTSRSLGSVVPSFRPGVVPADLRAVLPPFVIDNLKFGIRQMDRQLHGFALPDAVLTGVETRSSSPVRLKRGEDRMTAGIDGLFPAGEGAGYAGGIVSAAVDGIQCALAAIRRSVER